MAEYIERDEAVRKAIYACIKIVGHGISHIDAVDIADEIDSIPTADVVEVHKVAELFLLSFGGDTCACNFNGNDEWLPYLCELQEACPHPCGVACWEQYLKYRHCKNEMEAKEE